MVSRRCDHCSMIKRCRMVVDSGGRIAYLCPPCAKALEYDAGIKRERAGKTARGE